MIIARVFFVAISSAIALTAATAADGQVNPGFEDGAPGSPPPGWFSTVPGYEAVISEEDPVAGRQCLRFEKSDPNAGMTGVFMQAFDAAPFRGKRIRLAAQVRYNGPGRAQLWMRVDRKDQRRGFFDNMGDRPIVARHWREYAITGNVDDDAVSINIGLHLIGGGTVWLDDFSVSVVGAAVELNEPARPLSERGLRNLSALARLYGLVRYFHPSDEAAALDWTAFLQNTIGFIEDAEDDAALIERLRRAFLPVAPMLTIESGDLPANPDDTVKDPDEWEEYIAWRHIGVGFEETAARQIYSSRRIRASWINATDTKTQLPPAGAITKCELVTGVWCAVPLTLPIENDRTPAATAADMEPIPARELPEGWIGNGNDRTTRLASVIIAWNVFQHFYPYFDVVDTDWPAALRSSLKRATEDADDVAFHDTLSALVAQLHDGHGMVVYSRGSEKATLPLAITVLPSGEVVVADSAYPPGTGPARGEVIIAMGGTPIEKVIANHVLRISAATEQFRRWRLGQSLVQQPPGKLDISVRRGDGTAHTYRLQLPSPHVAGIPSLRHEPRPEEKLTELEQGLWYLDLSRITDQDFRDALPEIESARGLILDLRGYPSAISPVIIAHLIDEPVRSAQWHIPIVTHPDFEQVQWNESFWPVQSQAPRLTSNVAFLTDGRAISYAETYLGIIEHFDIAEIVGEATAGTNGNVNPFSVPGDYTIIWTGMRVLKHNGSQHHGVGILPTAEVDRTVEGIAAGRDEVLEAAINIITKRMSAEE